MNIGGERTATPSRVFVSGSPAGSDAASMGGGWDVVVNKIQSTLMDYPCEVDCHNQSRKRGGVVGWGGGGGLIGHGVNFRARVRTELGTGP